ncbi:hypothetical protein KPL71_021602 [Citrus sinensis]|uniref:Uncharacterized protein n=1 Tax=Citrus sinensis TaxID=2711 RepID=A0ACB8JJ72_CITSI|nr:hypothetical protein KPL71_021602 [Citrus sinensis]
MAQPDQPTQGQTSHTEPYVDIPSEVEEEMPESSATNQPPPTQTNPSSQKSSNGPWFTFDDLPSHKWRDRLNEMSAWIDLQMLRPGATTQSVLREFATRFTGALRDWFDSLGQYRQLQFVDLPEVSSALAVLHDQFLGDPSAVFEAARRDYLNMKCCSLNAKDLDFHYKRMSLLFYKLNGFNEPTLKHNLSEVLAKSLICRSNATRKRIAIAVQRKKGIFGNSKLQNLHPDLVDPESPTGSSERNLPPLENSNESNQADVSSAREKATMPKIAPTKEKNPSAVNGKLFTTSLITKKPIGIQIFPNCVIWTKVIGSTLPNKDILLGFDILHQIKHLQIIPTGIRVKSMFKPFTDILKLYNLSETPQSYQDISTKLLSFCPESHSEFTHPNPLWKNKSFFIKLPFKLNEDINPTKATHPGMSPSDLLLAQQECSQLLAQGLIEPTSSQWACQAFYVEKHSEIVRGQKRLVIDYQPLNMFLQDDKFPLPRRQSMFTFLKNAQIFSKFDLKSGFWQLGIEPSERYKTAFCIPNAHFQWTVLPFGLKTAPSIFQKSMVQIFQPILHHALIYIDDILLFSGSHDEHRQLLTQFYDILQSHGIMLSAKKSIIATDNQVQQFLGIINYIRDFLPHVNHHTSKLSALLKKNPPSWLEIHSDAVKQLKQIAHNPPPLKLITDGKRILQIDASDESWGAILLEECNGKEPFIAYASGQFPDTQKHYHTIYKEILAVKTSIKKFEFHLIGHRFLIRLDNSAFPNILNFK